MRTLTTITILTLLMAISCNNNNTTVESQDLKSGITADSSATQIKTGESSINKNVLQYDSLPIHGALNQKQIDQYYPHILDTIKDRRIIGSEPIDIKTKSEIYVSMLHNTGTFDQMFLCTHDNKFNLLDNFYLGTSTMFEKTSHTIEYKKIGDNSLEVYHVNWGWVNKNGESEIDTLNHSKYILNITEAGKIVKK